ncbi:MAG: hypothetical protein ACTS6H_00380 [Candidatus Hodgkinia cicadicola]
MFCCIRLPRRIASGHFGRQSSDLKIDNEMSLTEALTILGMDWRRYQLSLERGRDGDGIVSIEESKCHLTKLEVVETFNLMKVCSQFRY